MNQNNHKNPHPKTSQAQQQALDTLISVSGTIAGIALALVGILSGKRALTNTESITDDLFLFAAVGHLLVVALGIWRNATIITN